MLSKANQKFGDICQRSKKKFDPKVCQEKFKCIELEHITSGSGLITGSIPSSEISSTKNRFTKGDVLFSKLRPYLKKYAFAEDDGVCSSEVWVLKPGENTDGRYLFYLIQTDSFITNANKSSGSKMPRADWSVVSEFPVSLPSLYEQQKIAACLSTWDAAIEAVEEQIELATKKKKALMQKLLTGEVRLPGFNQNFKTTKLSELVCISNEKTRSNNQHPVITSSRRGIILQSEYFTKQVASKDTSGYKIVNKGSFTFRSMSDDGLFVFNKQDILEKAAVSPAYGVFSARNCNSDYLKLILNSQLMKKEIYKISQGGTRIALKPTSFDLIHLPIPSIDEQNKISTLMHSIDEFILFMGLKRSNLLSQKHSLMQQLLGGH